MKKIIFWMVTAILMTGFLGSTAHAQSLMGSFKQQKNRIYQGKVQGQLTPNEFRFLMKERARLAWAYRQAMQDGRFTPKERKRIRKRLNDISRRIYQLKHNHRTDRRDYRNYGFWGRGAGFDRMNRKPCSKKSGHLSFAPYRRPW